MNMEPIRGWEPDWAIHPGEYLEEHLEVREWSQADFARFSGLSKKLVSEIISRKNPVTPETALRLERVLGVKAHIWTGLQSDWDLHQARVSSFSVSADDRAWMKRQPIRELKNAGIIATGRDEHEILEDLLSFYRIGTTSAYSAKVASTQVHYREGRGRGEVLSEYVFAWLMMGEWKARSMKMPEYDAERFKVAVSKIRDLTTESPLVFEPEMKRLCGEAGVALIFEPPFRKTKLFGSARWIDGVRPVIQMSLRMKTNDHFWWTFFHECGHILLHAGRDFADDQNSGLDELENEANEFAENALVGKERLNAILAQRPQSKQIVRAIARELNLHPGILVGMLQHHRVLEFRFMNDLKSKFEFRSD